MTSPPDAIALLAEAGHGLGVNVPEFVNARETAIFRILRSKHHGCCSQRLASRRLRCGVKRFLRCEVG
jgi:hypothetical protein